MGDGSSRSKSASLIGEVLGSYQILDEIESGGMGTVYRARHKLLGRAAAIKLLHREFSNDPELVQRFFNEAKAATAIKHPGIVEVFDFGYSADNRAYLVMEYLEGDTLRARMEKRGPLAEADAIKIVRGVAGALTAAHGKGIIHRDLKPENVFLIPDPETPGSERAKVLDFGIAKLANFKGTGQVPAIGHTSTERILGTPKYMSPEQARATGDIDGRADLYSLGCMLYELLVGKPPFVATSLTEQIALQMFGEVVRPSKSRPVTAALETIVLKLLEKEPKDRFQSAADLVRALDAVGRPAPISLQTPVPWRDEAPESSRGVHPIVIVLAVLAVLSAIAAAVIVIRYR
jgi:serine/threonine-protein kinase